MSRQYNLVDWYGNVSNSAISLTSRAGTDILELTLPADGTSCSSWFSIMRSAFQAAGGSDSYDSYIWIFPAGFDVAGCDSADPEGGSVRSQKGPCTDGCDIIMYGCPYLNSYYYAIGRSLGLTRSNSAAARQHNSRAACTCMTHEAID